MRIVDGSFDTTAALLDFVGSWKTVDGGKINDHGHP